MLKYALDAALVYGATHELLLPRDYLRPVLTQRLPAGDVPMWLSVALLVTTLPFLWAGLAMTFRRVVDAGWSACLALG